MANRAVAALLLFRDSEGRWSGKVQARGVTRHTVASQYLVTVLEDAETFIRRQLEPGYP